MGTRDVEEQLEAAKAEMVRLEAENAQLRRDLDAGFAESDHLSAKYYQRMRAAEGERDEAVGRAMVWAKSCAAANERAEHAEAVIGGIRDALSWHPECDRHQEGEPVSCGWKATVQDIDAALATYQNGADQP